MNAKKLAKLSCVYINPDGSALLVFKERVHGKDIEYGEAYRTLPFRVTMPISIARVVIGSHADLFRAAIAMKATSMEVDFPSVGKGSQHSQEKGIVVGNLTLTGAFGYLIFQDFPGLMCGQYSTNLTAVGIAAATFETYGNHGFKPETFDGYTDRYGYDSMEVTKYEVFK